MKNIIKKTSIASIVVISSITISGLSIALDATQVSNTLSFVPNANTKAARAEQSATTALNKATAVEGTANSAYSQAQEANGIAKGTRATLINPNGCVFNKNFNCTEANLTKSYKSKSWTTPGTYYWTVPAGVTKIFVNAVGSEGNVLEYTVSSEYPRYSQRKTTYATNTSVNSIVAKIGLIGTKNTNLLYDYSWNWGEGGATNYYYKGNPGLVINKAINTIPGQRITIKVGRGPVLGYQVNSDYNYKMPCGWHTPGNYCRKGVLHQGKNGSVNIQY